jgi:hypothetical protein
MWSILIGLIERWWREKPRLDVIRTVVHLRDAMMDCQNWYSQYLEALKAGDLETLDPHPRVEWTRSLTTLSEREAELDTVLSIFSPEAHKAITAYLRAENQLVGAMGLEVAAKELHQPLDLDIQNIGMSTTFSDALGQLRDFIGKNFKPDEIFAAGSRRRDPGMQDRSLLGVFAGAARRISANQVHREIREGAGERLPRRGLAGAKTRRSTRAETRWAASRRGKAFGQFKGRRHP